MSLEEIREELEKRFVSAAANAGLMDLTAEDADRSFASLFGRTSVIAVLIYAVAAAMWAKDRLLTNWLSAVEETAAGTRYGTYQWWVKTAKEFQNGDNTEVIDGKVGYAIIDESKRIVQAACVVQNGRNLTVKVAKRGAGGLAALSGEELERFRGYVQNVKPIGIVVDAVSSPPSQVRLWAKVAYNADKSEADIKEELRSAVSDYLANIGFGGTIYTSRIVEAMMGVKGVVDARIFGVGKVMIDGHLFMNEAVPEAGYATLAEANISVTADYDKSR